MKFPAIRRRTLVLLSSLLAVLAVIVVYAAVSIEDRPAEASGTGRATLHGVTVSIVSIVASTEGTAVRIRVQGREDLGEILSATSRPVLVEESGARHDAQRASVDPDDPRQQTIFFEELAVDGPVSVVLSDLVFETESERDARIEQVRAGGGGQSTSDYGHTVPGKWTIAATIPGRLELAREATVNVAAAYGPGTMFLERVAVRDTEIVVTGHFEGFLPDQFADLEIAPAAMTVDRVTAQFVGGRSGYGPGNASFELRFANIAGMSAKLTVPFNVAGVNAPSPAKLPSSLANLAPYAGSAATVEFALPLGR
jgi:hypothetical protein